MEPQEYLSRVSSDPLVNSLSQFMRKFSQVVRIKEELLKKRIQILIKHEFNYKKIVQDVAILAALNNNVTREKEVQKIIESQIGYLVSFEKSLSTNIKRLQEIITEQAYALNDKKINSDSGPYKKNIKLAWGVIEIADKTATKIKSLVAFMPQLIKESGLCLQLFEDFIRLKSKDSYKVYLSAEYKIQKEIKNLTKQILSIQKDYSKMFVVHGQVDGSESKAIGWGSLTVGLIAVGLSIIDLTTINPYEPSQHAQAGLLLGITAVVIGGIIVATSAMLSSDSIEYEFDKLFKLGMYSLNNTDSIPWTKRMFG